MSIATRLKELRTSREILAKDMAANLDLSYRNYQRYENGDIDIPCTKLIALADFFGVSVDYLVGRTDNPEVNK